MGTRITVILKPTGACNMHCVYCYQSADLRKKKMTAETLEQVVKGCLELADDVEFLWHGGEPLLMGVDFYEKAVELQGEHKTEKQRVRNTMQTNLTLLTQKYIDFFKAHRFGLGSSLDGPRDLHDALRPYHNGSSTFDDILGKIKLMRDNGMHIGVITVLTKLHLGRMKDLYEFFKAQNLSTKVNPIFSEGRGVDAFPELGITPEQYGQSMIELFELWFNDPNPTIRIDSLDKFYHGILFKKPRGCDFGQDCRTNFISVNYAGDFFPCGRFNGDGEFHIGNVFSSNIKDIVAQQIEKTGKREVESCKPCNWYEVCYSGCLHNAYTAHGTINAPDYFCKGIKMIYAHMERVIDAELDKAAEKRKARMEEKDGIAAAAA